MRDTLYDGRPFRTLNVIDEGNREGLRIEVGRSISATRVVRVMNAFIERSNKSLRDEVLDAHLFNTLSEAQEAAETWLEDYNEYRPHESLGRLPPAIFKPSVYKP